MSIRNSISLTGRIAGGLNMTTPQTTASGKTYQKISFGLFVDRQGSDKADYIPVTKTIWSGADGTTNLGPYSYIGKGDLVALEGHIETWFSEAKDGSKKFGMQIAVDSIDIALEPKSVREDRRNRKS